MTVTSARARGKQELDEEICGMRFMYIRDCTSMHNDDVCFSLSVCVHARVNLHHRGTYAASYYMNVKINKMPHTLYGIAVPTELVNVWIFLV